MIVKDPDATLDYAVDWNDWLQAGEVISSHEVFVSGVALESSAEAGGVVTAWLSGGSLGSTATVTVRVVTNLGRTDDRALALLIAQQYVPADDNVHPCVEAETLRKALRDLAMGVTAVRVRTYEDDVTYRAADVGLLRELLADAERRCREAQSDNRRRRFAMGARFRPY